MEKSKAKLDQEVAELWAKLEQESEDEDTILAPGLTPGGDSLDGHKLSGELKLDDRVC